MIFLKAFKTGEKRAMHLPITDKVHHSFCFLFKLTELFFALLKLAVFLINSAFMIS